jgi:hypothetical protein
MKCQAYEENCAVLDFVVYSGLFMPRIGNAFSPEVFFKYQIYNRLFQF